MDVNIRGVNRTLWRRFCAVAAQEGMTRKAAVLEALRVWIRRKTDDRGKLAEPGASLAPANRSGQPV